MTQDCRWNGDIVVVPTTQVCMVVTSVLQNGSTSESESSCMQLNTRVSNKKLSLENSEA